MNDNFQDHQIRDVIKINYNYTMGGQSKFFIEIMKNKKLLGTKCTKCGKTWMPPRINCSDCYAPADWTELKQTGTIEVSTIVWYTYCIISEYLTVIMLSSYRKCTIK